MVSSYARDFSRPVKRRRIACPISFASRPNLGFIRILSPYIKNKLSWTVSRRTGASASRRKQGTYIGNGAQARDRNATSVDAQLIPRRLYICVVNKGNAVRSHTAVSQLYDVLCDNRQYLHIPDRHRTTTLPARTLRFTDIQNKNNSAIHQTLT